MDYEFLITTTQKVERSVAKDIMKILIQLLKDNKDNYNLTISLNETHFQFKERDVDCDYFYISASFIQNFMSRSVCRTYGLDYKDLIMAILCILNHKIYINIETDYPKEDWEKGLQIARDYIPEVDIPLI